MPKFFLKPKYGRIRPTDWEHTDKYPITKVYGTTTPVLVEKVIPKPSLSWWYNQGSSNGCVGYSCSYMMSTYNRRVYDAKWLYYRATEVDLIPWTTPESDLGTTVRAAFEVLRRQGHSRVQFFPYKSLPPIAIDGISSYYWCFTVDQCRMAISDGRPIIFGINWYEEFMHPIRRYNGHWIGTGALGRLLGQHAILCNGASDSREGFKLANSWGPSYPEVWIPYTRIAQLLGEEGEAGVAYDT